MIHRVCVLALVGILMPTLLGAQVIVANQEKQDGGPPQQGGAMIVRASGVDGAMKVMSFSTIDGNVMQWGGPMALPISADPSTLMFDDQVRQELELVDDQVEKLRQIQNEFSQKMKDKMNFTTGPDADPNQFKEIGKVIREMNQMKQDAMNKVLLPHQVRRLQQISTQMDIQRRGDAAVLASKKLAEELGIDEEQQKRLKERSEEIKKEIEAEIAKLKEQGRKKLLRELTSEQRQKLDEMTGEKFEYKKRDFRSQIKQMRKSRQVERDHSDR